MTALLFGVDAVPLDRVRRLAARYGDGFAARVAGPDEVEVLRALEASSDAGLAVLFAVKESVVKAVGGRPEGFRWADVVTIVERPATPVEATDLLDTFAEQVSPLSRGTLGVRLTGSLTDRRLAGTAEYGQRDDHVLAAVTLWTTDPDGTVQP